MSAAAAGREQSGDLREASREPVGDTMMLMLMMMMTMTMMIMMIMMMMMLMTMMMMMMMMIMPVARGLPLNRKQ